MDLDSAGSTPKRSRSKAKTANPGSEAVAKKPTRSRKAKATSEPAAITVTSITAIATPRDDELLGMIATAAYYRAEQRNFAPGHELDDWLEAERQIRTLYT